MEYDYAYDLCNATLFDASMAGDECYDAVAERLACLSMADCRALGNETACPEEAAAVAANCPG